MKKYSIQIAEINEDGSRTPVKDVETDACIAAWKNGSEWSFQNSGTTIGGLLDLAIQLQKDEEFQCLCKSFGL